jgi:cellulose synthase operon protein YhjQ
MKTISFISGKGGVGKSTICANLATTLVKRNKKVVVIDLDPQNSQRLHLGLGPDEIGGVVREGIAVSSLFDSPFGVNFIPFGRVSDEDLEEFRTELLQSATWTLNQISSLSGCGFDYVFIDTPPGSSVYLEQALRASDKAILVVLADAASYVTLPKMNELIALYTKDQPHFKGVSRLINQMPTESRLGHQVRNALLADDTAELIPLAIHKDPSVARALAFERPVLEYEPGSMASLDFQYLADWFLASFDQQK